MSWPPLGVGEKPGGGRERGKVERKVAGRSEGEREREGAMKRRKAGETRKVAAEAAEGRGSGVEGGRRGGREGRGLVGAGGRRGKRTLRCVIASGASAHRRGID